MASFHQSIDLHLTTQTTLDYLLDRERLHEFVSPIKHWPVVKLLEYETRRQILIDWMGEVCEAKDCHDNVFVLAVNYLDRYIINDYVGTGHLQLLGGVCLFIASKFLEPINVSFSLREIVHYTDGGVSTSEVKAWELRVLEGLNWDLNNVTAVNFIDILLHMTSIAEVRDSPNIKSHSEGMVLMAMHDVQMHLYLPSVLASACILNVYLRGKKPETSMEIVQAFASDIKLSNFKTLTSCINNLELMLKLKMKNK